MVEPAVHDSGRRGAIIRSKRGSSSLEDVTHLQPGAAHAPARQELGTSLTYPDGRDEMLLAVPKYDFNWQTDYMFAQPLRVPKGSMLKSVAHYDNSEGQQVQP